MLDSRYSPEWIFNRFSNRSLVEEEREKNNPRIKFKGGSNRSLLNERYVIDLSSYSLLERDAFEIGRLNGTKLAKELRNAKDSESKRIRSRLWLSRFEFSRVGGGGVCLLYYLLEHDGGKYSKNRLPEFNAPTTCIEQKVRR